MKFSEDVEAILDAQCERPRLDRLRLTPTRQEIIEEAVRLWATGVRVIMDSEEKVVYFEREGVAIPQPFIRRTETDFGTETTEPFPQRGETFSTGPSLTPKDVPNRDSDN